MTIQGYLGRDSVRSERKQNTYFEPCLDAAKKKNKKISFNGHHYFLVVTHDKLGCMMIKPLIRLNFLFYAKKKISRLRELLTTMLVF